MKDNSDKETQDMFGEKRGRGRPKTGKAKSGAERQAIYRAKQQRNNVTVTINKALLNDLSAQLQEKKETSPTVTLTLDQANELINAINPVSE